MHSPGFHDVDTPQDSLTYIGSRKIAQLLILSVFLKDNGFWLTNYNDFRKRFGKKIAQKENEENVTHCTDPDCQI
jgi:hypothetical protein